MPKQPPAALIFDLGKVLIDWDPRHLYRKLIPDEMTREAFLRDVWSPEINEATDMELRFADAIAKLKAEHPAQTELIEAYWQRWPEMLNGAIPGTLAILEALRAQGYRLFALSNWSAETFPCAWERFAFLQWFEYLAISGHLGLKKPQPEIFQHLLAKIGHPASEVIFIDDSPRNIAAARALGIDAIHFTTPTALLHELTARDIALPLTPAQLDERA